MNAPRIVVTGKIPDAGLALLEGRHWEELKEIAG